MALTQASEGGLKISNAGTNGQYLQKQSGNTGGLTWADVGGAASITFNDSVAANFGTDGDQAIWHTGSVGYIRNSTGGFCIRNDNFSVKDDAESEIMLTAVKDGAVTLYHNNIKTFETTAYGANLVGPEGGAAQLNLYADEGDDFADVWAVQASAGGTFEIQNKASGSWEKNIECNGDGNVELYYNNTKKFETTSTGITVSGLHVDGGVTFDNATNAGKDINWNEAEDKLKFEDNVYAKFGSGNDLSIYHDGTDSRIDNSNGNLILRVASNEKAIACVENGAVELYYNDVKTLETADNGFVHIAGASDVRLTLGSEGTAGNNNSNWVRGTSTNIMYNSASGNHTWEVGGTEKLRLQSGGGLSFNGDTAAANALDDYEEGTFDAQVTAHTTAPTISGTTDWPGYYTKIGNVVHVNCYIAGPNITNAGSGIAKITGLPFTCKNRYTAITITHNNMTANTCDNGYIQPGNAYFYPIQEHNTSGSALATGVKYMMFAGTYLTDS